MFAEAFSVGMSRVSLLLRIPFVHTDRCTNVFILLLWGRLARIDSRWHSELNNATESVSIALRGEFPSISTIEDICVYMGAPEKLSSKAIGKIGIDTL